jgi:cytochrome P450
MQQWAMEYGPTFLYRIGSVETVCLSDATAVQEILKHRPDQFSRQKLLAETIAGTGFRGLFTAEGEDWQSQRPVIMRGLSPTIVGRAFPMIDQNTTRMLEQWDTQNASNTELQINKDLKTLSLHSVLWTTLGIDANTLKNGGQDLSNAIDKWFATVGRRARQPGAIRKLMQRYPSNATKTALNTVNSAVKTAITNARNRMTDSEREPSNMLEAMLRPSSGEAPMTEEQVIGNTATMIIAGQETTASAMSWMLLHLSENPEIAKAIHTTLPSPLPKEPKALLDALNNCAALRDLCLKCLGERPVAPLVGLTTLQSVKIGNLVIPENRNVVLMLRQPGQSTPIAKPTTEKLTAERFAFGAGPRLCPGRYLALAEMMTLAAHIILMFELTRQTPLTEVREKYSFTMYPETVPVQLRPRTPTH